MHKIPKNVWPYCTEVDHNRVKCVMTHVITAITCGKRNHIHTANRINSDLCQLLRFFLVIFMMYRKPL